MESAIPAKIQPFEPRGWGGVRGGVNPPPEEGIRGFSGTQDTTGGLHARGQRPRRIFDDFLTRPRSAKNCRSRFFEDFLTGPRSAKNFRSRFFDDFLTRSRSANNFR